MSLASSSTVALWALDMNRTGDSQVHSYTYALYILDQLQFHPPSDEPTWSYLVARLPRLVQVVKAPGSSAPKCPRDDLDLQFR